MKKMKHPLFLMTFLILSCSSSPEKKPGELLKFYKIVPEVGSYHFELTTANGSWSKPNLDPRLELKMVNDGMMLMLTKVPGPQEKKLMQKLAREKGYQHYYINFVKVTLEPQTMTPEEVQGFYSNADNWNNYRAQNQTRFSEYKEERFQDVQVAGWSGKILEFEGTHSEMGRLAIRDYYLVSPEVVIRIVVQTPVEGKTAYFTDVDKMIQSLKINKY